MGGEEIKIKMAQMLPMGNFTAYLGTGVPETQPREENTTPSLGRE